jgi:thiamine-phosphate pyrophosphorylase
VDDTAVLGVRHLYLCTADRPDLVEFLEACLRGGVDLVQLRDKELAARPLIERARLAKRVCAAHGVPFIVNDRPDLALAAEADGVHVGQDDVPPGEARRLLGPEAIVGLSTHARAELDASRDDPVDYISAGPVEPTPTKPGRPGTGPDYVAEAVQRAGRPVFVTGGITPETVPPLVTRGATHFVVVRYLTRSDRPERDARRLRTAIDEALGTRAAS